MRIFFLILCLAIASIFPPDIRAQDGAPVLRIINVVSLETPTKIKVDGYPLMNGDPVACGDGSGILSVPPGPHSVEVSNPGAKNSKISVQMELKPGTTSGLIFYLESKKKKSTDKNAEPEFEHYIQHTILTGRDEIGKPRMTLFSVCRAETVDIRIRGSQKRLARQSSMKIDLEESETVSFKGMDDSDVGEVFVFAPVHFVGFVYDDLETGGYGLAVYQQQKYSLDPPRLKFDDE